MGINSMSVYLGLLTGPFLGGFLAQVSWRAAFLLPWRYFWRRLFWLEAPPRGRCVAGRVLIGWARRCWRFRWPWWCWASRRLPRFSQV